MKLCKNLKGGLQEVADQLELRRVGPQHQAGSDSHLTGMAFFKIKEVRCQSFTTTHFIAFEVQKIYRIAPTVNTDLSGQRLRFFISKYWSVISPDGISDDAVKDVILN